MAYATYEEMILRYPLVKTWGDNSPTDVNSGLIYFAEIELNSKLATHYTVPFSAAHPTVKDLTIELAYYRVLAQTDAKKAKELNDRIIGRIDRLKSGNEYIYTGSGTTIVPSAPGQSIWSTVKDYHPVHSMLDAESGYTVVDSDLLQAERDAR